MWTLSASLLGKQQQKITKSSEGTFYPEGLWLEWLQTGRHLNRTKKGLRRRTFWQEVVLVSVQVLSSTPGAAPYGQLCPGLCPGLRVPGPTCLPSL